MIRQKLLNSVSDLDNLVFNLSTEHTDRYGDVVVQRGINTTNFQRNPVALLNHQHSFVIGRWDNVGIEDGVLRGRLKLAPAGSSDKLDEVRALVKAGILTATSIGFRALESEPRPGGGVRYTQSELVECSLVAVPANPNALMQAKSLGVSEGIIKMAFDRGDDPQRRAWRNSVMRKARQILAESDPSRSRSRSLTVSKNDRVRETLARMERQVEYDVALARMQREEGERVRIAMNYDPFNQNRVPDQTPFFLRNKKD